MSKKFKGFKKKKYVGSIDEVQKHPDVFYRDFEEYVNEFQTNNNDGSKLSRFIELIKITDVYIDDEGNLANQKFNDIFDWLLTLNIGQETYKQIIDFKRSIKYLLEIKNRLSKLPNQFKYYVDCFSASNYIFNYKLSKSSNQLEDMENNISVSSFCFRKIKDKISSVEVLNVGKAFSGVNSCNSIFSYIQFSEIMKMWKFSEARIYKKQNKIIVDNVTDYAKAFVVTRNINQENRNLPINLKRETQITSYLQGLGEEFFEGLDENDNEVNKRAQKLENFTVYGLSIKRWLEILIKFKRECIEYFKKNGDYWVKINNFFDCKDWNEGELKLIANVLNFKNDFLDTPFFMHSGKIYAYIPAIIVCDPVHVMHIVLKYNKDKSMQNIRGANFEQTIGRILDKCSRIYCKSEIDETTGNELKIKFGKNEDEIDLIVEDDEKHLASIECKTFMDPFNYRDYRIELDKMYANDSNGYLENDSMHYMALKENGHNILYRNVNNIKSKISKNKSLRNFFSRNLDWSSLYPIFITNFIFPRRLIEKWTKEYNFYFVHWFEFNRLIKDIPLNENFGWTSVKPIITNKIDDEFKGFSNKTISEINSVQPLSKLIEERKDIVFDSKYTVVPHKLKIIEEANIIDGVIIRYYE